MAEAELPSCFDPYLRYAIATNFKYFELFDDENFKLFLLVEFKDAKQAAAFEKEMDDDKHEHKPGIEFGPTDPNSRYATIRASKAAVGPPPFRTCNTHLSTAHSSPPQNPPASKHPTTP